MMKFVPVGAQRRRGLDASDGVRSPLAEPIIVIPHLVEYSPCPSHRSRSVFVISYFESFFRDSFIT